MAVCKKYRTSSFRIALSLSVTCVIALLSYDSFAANQTVIKPQKDSIFTFKKEKTSKSSKKKVTHFTSGTGFFVSNNYIITNEHVVQGCKSIKIRGAVKDANIELYAIDKENDLALLKTSKTPGRIAPIRGEIPLHINDNVTVIGYPLDRSIKGSYLIKKAKIIDTEDYYAGIERIQFTDSVEKGNSGGPLLDENGTVIGVVVGKMSFYLADSSSDETEAKPVKTTSMAISLDTLKNFMDDNNVFYRTDNTYYYYPDKNMEEKAKQYVVNVHCIKG